MTDVATPAAMKGAKSYAKGVSGRIKAVKEAGAKEAYDSFKRKNGFSRISSTDNDFRIYAMDP